MMNFSTLILFISLLFKHPFHASVCEIEYNTKRQSFEISLRLFIDDLEVALESKHSQPLDLINQRDKKEVQSMIENYLKENLKFWINGDKAEINYLGDELEGFALWSFIEISNAAQPETLEVDNNLLVDSFDDQINLIHFSKADQVRSLKLRKGKTFGRLQLAELFN